MSQRPEHYTVVNNTPDTLSVGDKIDIAPGKLNDTVPAMGGMFGGLHISAHPADEVICHHSWSAGCHCTKKYYSRNTPVGCLHWWGPGGMYALCRCEHGFFPDIRQWKGEGSTGPTCSHCSDSDIYITYHGSTTVIINSKSSAPLNEHDLVCLLQDQVEKRS